jgi:hypothetical protein
MSIIGICGNARSGKDTLANLIVEVLEDINVKSEKLALADELKLECQDFVFKTIGIDVFTENTEEKSIIRPLLVAWGTHVRRKIDPDIWINKAASKMKSDRVTIITDIRYPNELSWLRKQDSYCIFVDRIDESGQFIPPANTEEEQNYTFMKDNSDFQLTWSTVGCDNLHELKDVAIAVLEKTVSEEKIHSWTQTFC